MKRNNFIFTFFIVILLGACKQVAKKGTADTDTTAYQKEKPVAQPQPDPEKDTANNQKLSDCENARQQAIADDKGDSLKYYFFGIAAPGSQMLDSIKKAYGIHVVSMGCVIIPDLNCYNEMADEVLNKKYGKTVTKILQNR